MLSTEKRADSALTKTSLETGQSALPTSSRLLTTAARLFRRHGYHATSTREIAAALGINKGTLYHHIKGKEDLLYLLCAQCLDNIHTRVARAIAAEPDSVAKLRELIRVHVETMLKDRDEHAAMLLELKSLTGNRATEIIRLRNDYEQMVRSVVRGAQLQGAIRADIETKYLSLAMLNLLNWTIFWFEPGDELTPAGLGAILTEIYLDGALSPTATPVGVRPFSIGHPGNVAD